MTKQHKSRIFQSPPTRRHDDDDDDDNDRRFAMNDNHQRSDTNNNHHDTKNNGYHRSKPSSPRPNNDDNDDQKSQTPPTHHRSQHASPSARVCFELITEIFLSTNIFICACMCLCTRIFWCDCFYMLLYSLTKKTRIMLPLLFNLMFGVILHVKTLFVKRNSQLIN